VEFVKQERTPLAAASTSARDIRLIANSKDIQERRAEKRDAGYLAREMVLCSLPHRDPKTLSWSRDTGDAWIGITSGISLQTGKALGIPYGAKSRLLLYWITSEVKRTKNRKLLLFGKKASDARTFSDFIRKLGMDASRGGIGSNSQSLKEAMMRLFSASIVMEDTRSYPNDLERHQRKQFLITSDSEIWWNKRSSRLGEEEDSWIEIGEKLFDSIQASVVPADMRAINALRDSPMAMDLYALLNYFGVNRPKLLLWREMEKRIGADYASTWEFARKVKEALPKVLSVHPGLEVQIAEEGGLRVYRSEPAIPAKE
jgi:hypothetical protein